MIIKWTVFDLSPAAKSLQLVYSWQGLVKGAKLCFRYPYFYFRYGESSSTASQLSKEINKVPLLLQNLGSTFPFQKIHFESMDEIN